MVEDILGVAFLGCGRVAEWQATFFENGIKGAKVRMVCDLDATKAQNMAKRLDSGWTTEVDAILSDDSIDVVIIMSESGYHYFHSKQVLKFGKHVIVEKPPCMFAEQILELKQNAEERGLMYAPIFQNRYNPAITILKKHFDQGRFGKITCISVRLFWCRFQEYYEDGWHGTWQLDGGVINQQAIHHIDAMQWICGSVSEVVSMQANRLNELEAEDTTVALVKFDDGALGTIEVTTAARPADMDASLTIIGEKGSVSIGGIALNKVCHWNFVEKIPEDEIIPDQFSQEVPNGYGYSHGTLLSEIIDRIRAGGIVSPIDPESTASTVQLIHALYRSEEDKRVVEIKNKLRSKRLGNDGPTT